jgi:hypothetical protein
MGAHSVQIDGTRGLDVDRDAVQDGPGGDALVARDRIRRDDPKDVVDVDHRLAAQHAHRIRERP